MSAGEAIFSPGEVAERAYLIQQGAVRLVKTVGERELELVVLRPGDVFGEEALVDGAMRATTAIAHTDAEILALDRTTFRALLSGNAEVALRVVELLARRLQMLDEQLEHALLSDDVVRVVHVLVRACGDASEPASVSLSPCELAVRSTASVVAVREVVDTLAANGYVSVSEERVFVQEPASLRALMELLARREGVRLGLP